MKKTLVALSLLALASAASAQGLSDGFGVYGGVSSGNTAGESSTGYVLGADYTKYIAKGFFVQPSINYIDSKTAYNDKHVIGLIDGGYTFDLNNGITVSPKAGFGYRHTSFDGGSDSGVAYNVGVDVGFAKNWTVGLNYIRMKGQNGNHADFTNLSVGYKF
jgi:opacity protein-like surface antigen